MNNDVIKKLKFQNTAMLLLLTVVTLGIYAGYYIYRQSKTINTYLDKERKISEDLYLSILFLTILSPLLILLIFLSVFLSSNYLTFGLLGFNNIMDKIVMILFLVWVFILRDKIHFLLTSRKNSPFWFNGIWTFFLGIFYINYKINSIEPDNEPEKKGQVISDEMQIELDDALANYYLGESYLKLGRKEQAIGLWETALTLTKDEKLKKKIEKKLGENRA